MERMEVIRLRVTEYASRLQADLAYAAPEMFLVHTERRMADLVEAVLDDLEQEHEQ